MNKKRYGNDNCHCMLADGWESTDPIEIWKDIGLGHKEVIAHATDKFNAMTIVDAINVYNPLENEL